MHDTGCFQKQDNIGFIHILLKKKKKKKPYKNALDMLVAR